MFAYCGNNPANAVDASGFYFNNVNMTDGPGHDPMNPYPTRSNKQGVTQPTFFDSGENTISNGGRSTTYRYTAKSVTNIPIGARKTCGESSSPEPHIGKMVYALNDKCAVVYNKIVPVEQGKCGIYIYYENGMIIHLFIEKHGTKEDEFAKALADELYGYASSSSTIGGIGVGGNGGQNILFPELR